MRVLAIDTSGRFNAVCLMAGDLVVTDLVWEAEGNSLRDIILNIDAALRTGGVSLAELDGLAVGIGPGSWTGVRVGLTVGKMLAFSTARPLCGVSSLDALAYLGKDSRDLLCPLVEAGRGNVYAAFYRARDGSVSRLSEYYAGNIDGLLKMVDEPVVFMGDAVEQHRRRISEELGSLAGCDDSGDNGTGRAIASVASLRFERGESDDALSLSPLYLKEPLAQALLSQQREGHG